MDRSRRKEEVTESAFWDYLRAYPEKTAEDPAGRFCVVVETPHLLWHKPVAVRENGKFYIVRSDVEYGVAR